MTIAPLFMVAVCQRSWQRTWRPFTRAIGHDIPLFLGSAGGGSQAAIKLAEKVRDLKRTQSYMPNTSPFMARQGESLRKQIRTFNRSTFTLLRNRLPCALRRRTALEQEIAARTRIAHCHPEDDTGREQVSSFRRKAICGRYGG